MPLLALPDSSRNSLTVGGTTTGFFFTSYHTGVFRNVLVRKPFRKCPPTNSYGTFWFNSPNFVKIGLSNAVRETALSSRGSKMAFGILTNTQSSNFPKIGSLGVFSPELK